jgi:tetratricopeptide (TPR) repeat protein
MEDQSRPISQAPRVPVDDVRTRRRRRFNTILVVFTCGFGISTWVLFQERDRRVADEIGREQLIQTLKSHEKQLRGDLPDAAQMLFELSRLYYQNKQLDLAVWYGERAVNTQEQAFGREAPILAISLAHLASVQNDAGNYAAAEPLARRALRLQERLHPPGHIEIGRNQANLGLILMNEGNLDEAALHCGAALGIFEKSLDAKHPDIAMVLNNLASIDLRQKKYSEAKPLALRAVQIQEQRLGPEHPDLAIGLNELGQICDAEGDYAAAQVLYDRAAAIDAKALGDDHPYTLAIKLNAALTYKNRGRYDQAIGQLRSVAETFEKRGLQSESLEAKTELVEAMIQNKQYADVEPMAQDLYNRVRELPASERQSALQLLSALYDAWEKPEKAEEYRRAYTSVSGPTSVPTTMPFVALPTDH